jgi:uncharacterized protein (TIGR02598 family)
MTSKKGAFAPSGKSGFSLIETVIALGIVAFALVPMIGLMPFGLSAYRNAVDQTTGARIAQQIAGEYAVSSASLPQATTQKWRYFDVMGEETTGTAPTSDTIYYVNVVTNSGTLPGDTAQTRPLTLISIEVCYDPAHQTPNLGASNDLVIKTAGQQIREYRFYVAR